MAPLEFAEIEASPKELGQNLSIKTTHVGPEPNLTAVVCRLAILRHIPKATPQTEDTFAGTLV